MSAPLAKSLYTRDLALRTPMRRWLLCYARVCAGHGMFGSCTLALARQSEHLAEKRGLAWQPHLERKITDVWGRTLRHVCESLRRWLVPRAMLT